MDLGNNRFSGKVYTRRTKKIGVSPATTTRITSPEMSKVLKSEKVPPLTQDILIANSTTSGVVSDGYCGARVVDGGCSGSGGSQPSGNDELATVTFANDNPAVIDGIVERGKRIRKENKYYNNSEFLLAKDRLPYARPLGSKIPKNKKKEKKPLVSPQVSGIPVPKKPRAKDLKNKRELTNAEVAQKAAITSSGSIIVATLKASGTGEMHNSASSTHADNASSCSSD